MSDLKKNFFVIATEQEKNNIYFKKKNIMNSYWNMEIDNLSYKLDIKAHKFILTMPGDEIYEEGSQLRRSSKSVTSNIVEGYGRRKYKADFIKFLIYSHPTHLTPHLAFRHPTNLNK